MSRATLTATGHEVDLAYPRAEQMVIADIAHHLAQINRFCGATFRPYSVAEHSLLVEEIFCREFAADVQGRFAALMHDAHEAYVGDLITPAKAMAGPAWAHLEGRLQSTVRSAWALHTAATTWSAFIRQADLIALATERAQLLPPGGSLWERLQHVQPVTWVDLMSPERCRQTWADWRNAWQDTADALDYARNGKQFAVAQP